MSINYSSTFTSNWTQNVTWPSIVVAYCPIQFKRLSMNGKRSENYQHLATTTHANIMSSNTYMLDGWNVSVQYWKSTLITLNQTNQRSDSGIISSHLIHVQVWCEKSKARRLLAMNMSQITGARDPACLSHNKKSTFHKVNTLKVSTPKY